MRDAEPEGVDATISEGWLDLKVKNETDITFQISLSFDNANITGSLFTDKAMPFIYEIEGNDLSYSAKTAQYTKKSLFIAAKLTLIRKNSRRKACYIQTCAR